MGEKIGYIVFLSLLLFVAVMGCKKPFSVPLSATANSYLVVEGVINTGNDSTYIKLSRTVALSSKTTTRPETNARISIESENGAAIALTEVSSGRYGTGPLGLDPAKKCRLHINVSDGREYLSDLVEIKNTPEIDSISYHIQGTGLQFYVSAHDNNKNTHYYRWDFEETYKYVSNFRSLAILDDHGFPRFRTGLDPQIFECYKTLPSFQVLLGSTAKLDKDVIYQQPINFVDAGSGKISYGYSFLLRQYAITQPAFEYYQLLKKNTEQLGSVFDAQPSTTRGNISCKTNPAEPVIGFISACSIKAKRIYIDHFNIALFTPSYFPPPPVTDCFYHYVPIEPLDTYATRLDHIFSSGDTVLANPVAPPGGPVTGYAYGPKECIDCRAKYPKGTIVKPVFWP
ncbi:hypothetical protein BH09BAC6_BH09BAC6_05610 [soil metagenome]|jgi:hypothetical protein